jgi:zinc transport system ATP-binding protein
MHDEAGSCRTFISGLSVRAGGTEILEDVNLTFSCGEMTAIVGPNGAGKTTLLRAVLGEVPHDGEVRFEAPDGSPAKPRFGYVPQKVGFDRDLPASVLDCMAAAIYPRPIWLGPTRAQKEGIRKALATVNAENIAGKRIGDLSGGELQRMLLAMAMTPVPNLLLLDEPVSAVDRTGLAKFYETACGLRDRFDLSVIVVSHDIAGIAEHADRMILLSLRILAAGTPSEVMADPAFAALFGPVIKKEIPDRGRGTRAAGAER